MRGLRGGDVYEQLYGLRVEHNVELDDGTILAVVPDVDFNPYDPMYDPQVQEDLRIAVQDGDVFGVIHYDPNADEFEEIDALWGMAGYGSPEAAAEAYIKDGHLTTTSKSGWTSASTAKPSSKPRSEGDKLFEFFFGKKKFEGLRGLNEDSFEESFRTRDGARVSILVWADALSRGRKTSAYILTIDRFGRKTQVIRGRVAGELYDGVVAARKRLISAFAGSDEESE
jgi:hypothetical protein